MAVDSDGFPQPGHTPYSGAVKKYIKDASRAEAGAIAIEMLGSVGDINASVQRAEDAADRAEDISNIDTSVAAVDFALKEPGPQATLNAAIADGAPSIEYVAAAGAVIDTPKGAGNPLPFDSIGGYVYGAVGQHLYRATSVDGPWTSVRNFAGLPNANGDTFAGIKDAGDGEVLVFKHSNGVWKSSGWSANPLTASFSRVLDANGVRPFTYDVDPASGWAVVTNYIGTGDMTESRYAWKSTNHGATWTVVFDFVAAHPEHDKTKSHLHFIAIDKHHPGPTPRLWMSYHKTITDAQGQLKRLVYSDNGGATWTTLSTALQPVTGSSLPAGMVFGSDDPDINGLYIVRRTSTPADMKVEPLHNVRRNIDGYYGFATKAVQDHLGTLHVLFKKSGGTGLDLDALVISTDGVTSGETLIIPPTTATEVIDTTQLVVFDAEMIAAYSRNGGETLLARAPLPRRGGPSWNAGGIQPGSAGNRSLALGLYSRADSIDSLAVGQGATATGQGSTALGRSAASLGAGVAVGDGATASAANGVVIGALATVGEGVSIGWHSDATNESTAVGINAQATGGASRTAIGSYAKSKGTASVAVGHLAEANPFASVALGASAIVLAGMDGAMALGNGATASHANSVALGRNQTTTDTDQYAMKGRHIEMSALGVAPAAPAAGRARIYTRTNAGGKGEYVVRFPSGAVQILATEP